MGDLGMLSRECRQGFENLTSHLTKAKPEHLLELPLSIIQSQYGKFKVWCGNLGALSTGYSSLDYRLRESAVMQSTVAKLLLQLSSALIESTAVVSGARLPYEEQPKPADLSEDSTDESDFEEERKPRKELHMRMSSIVDCLNSLYRLSYKIRNPNLRPSTTKAARYREPDPDTNIDVFEEFKKFDFNHVLELLKLLRQSRTHPEGFTEYLPERLAESIVLRRRHFKYWQKHSKKLSHAMEIGELAPGLNLADMQISSRPKGPDGLSIAEGKKPAHTLNPVTILSRTDATPYDISFDEKTERATVVSFASTALDVDGKGIEFPGPPIQASKNEEFTCPYCHVLCPAKQGRGKSWKQHVLHDLQPYVCTYKDCPQEKELYRSRSQWVKHEDSVHRRCWRCPEHPDIIHKSAAGLKQHLTTQHSNTLTDTQIEQLTDIYSFTYADDRQCPICYKEQPFERGLANHLANHLERISLFSLPRNRSETEEFESKSGDLPSDWVDSRGSLHTPTSASETADKRTEDYPQAELVMIATVRKIDAAGKPYTEDMILEDGKEVHGEIISTKAAIDSSPEVLDLRMSMSSPEPNSFLRRGKELKNALEEDREGEESKDHHENTKEETEHELKDFDRRGAIKRILTLKRLMDELPRSVTNPWRVGGNESQGGSQELRELGYSWDAINDMVEYAEVRPDFIELFQRVGYSKEIEVAFSTGEKPKDVDPPRWPALRRPEIHPEETSDVPTKHRMRTSSGSGSSISSGGRVPLETKNTNEEPETNEKTLEGVPVQTLIDHSIRDKWVLNLPISAFEKRYGPIDDPSRVYLKTFTEHLFEHHCDNDWPSRNYAGWMRILVGAPKGELEMITNRQALTGIRHFHMWREQFRFFCNDERDKISFSNYQSVPESLGYSVSHAYSELLFSKFDTNNEGFLDFDSYMRSLAIHQRVTDIFQKHDDDRDGFITLSFSDFLSEVLGLIRMEALDGQTTEVTGSVTPEHNYEGSGRVERFATERALERALLASMREDEDSLHPVVDAVDPQA